MGMHQALDARQRADLVAGLEGQLNLLHQTTMASVRRHAAARGVEPETVIKTSLQGFVMAHGIGRYGMRCPVRKLADRLCFTHAFNLLLDDPRYIYCEGYASRLDLGIAIHHAWVIDPAAGYNVVDNTWRAPARAVYCGVPFKRDFVYQTLSRRRVYGVLDDWQGGYPILSAEPATFLHEAAGTIPADFTLSVRPDDGMMNHLLSGSFGGKHGRYPD